ncbi:MAG: signal peptidase II [Acidobacteriales bacterium]|nr:signal peptidase II [Terriglobales bacterium]
MQGLRRPGRFGAHVLGSLLVLAADQLSKNLIERRIPLHETVPVIPDFFSLSHVLNRGAAFSLFAHMDPEYVRGGLIVFSFLVAMAVTVALWRLSAGFSRVSIALSLILGGASGNLLDRIVRGSVVDFLAFQFGSYHWPDFNVADSAIVIGAGLLMLDVVLGERKPSPPPTVPD